MTTFDELEALKKVDAGKKESSKLKSSKMDCLIILLKTAKLKAQIGTCAKFKMMKKWGDRTHIGHQL
ncbi:hypothetical protein OUZ56_003356 [Daphnia magna]|uniref:Uncharacterized protein n=1 Tax=Daphnia magna TaxID=35525 RepID=A0ABR0A8H3_9CRUS|nr:hypothetical protein OUZ56_003356 [Daphnia magna]